MPLRYRALPGGRAALATPFERARSTRRLLVGGRLLLSLWAIGLSPADITDVVFPKRTGLSSLGFAMLVASFTIGGVAGAMATPRLSARFGTSRVLRLTAALTALRLPNISSARVRRRAGTRGSLRRAGLAGVCPDGRCARDR